MNRSLTRTLVVAAALVGSFAVGTARADVVKSFLEVFVVNDDKHAVPARVVNDADAPVQVEDVHRLQDPFHESVAMVSSPGVPFELHASMTWSQDNHVIEELSASINAPYVSATPAEAFLVVSVHDERTNGTATHRFSMHEHNGSFTVSIPIRLILGPGMTAQFGFDFEATSTASLAQNATLLGRVSVSGYAQR